MFAKIKPQYLSEIGGRRRGLGRQAPKDPRTLSVALNWAPKKLVCTARTVGERLTESLRIPTRIRISQSNHFFTLFRHRELRLS